jgi:single-strand DNA-binding protein
VDAWRTLAELTNEYLGKGSQVFIRGRLRVEEWADQSGDKRFSIKVTADQVQFLGGRSGEHNSSNQEAVGADVQG